MSNAQLRRTRLDDHDWMRQAFMVPHRADVLNARQTPDGDTITADRELSLKFFSSAQLKFATTTPGGNMVMNPLPQFTKYCDPRVFGLNPNRNFGLGRWYNNAIDDNKHLITLAVGHQSYNSLSNFWTGFYNSEAALVARTGRSRTMFYSIGRVAGYVVGLFSPWLVALSVGAMFMRVAMSAPQSKYCFFKSSMPTYWNAVSGFANEMAVRTQLISPVIRNDAASALDTRDVMSKEEIRKINAHISDILDSYDSTTNDANGINVYALATRYSRMAERAFGVMQEYWRQRDFPEDGDIQEELMAMVEQVRSGLNNSSKPSRGFMDYLKDWTGFGPGSSGEEVGLTSIGQNADGTDLQIEKPDALVEYVRNGSTPEDEALRGEWSDFYLAELNDGASFVSFRVDSQNQPSESFSTNTGESEVQSKFNGASGDMRSTRFNMADGNVGGGAVGSFIGGIVSRAKDAAIGVADSLGIGGIAALGGNAFVDIPKIVTGSSTSMPTMSYTIKLRTPYNNKFSRFINIWLPFSMLVPLAMPLSTGPSSYTSPFFVQLYDRGRAQSRHAVMKSMSITRGTTHLGFNRIGEPLGIDLTFEFEEMSSIIHMPIASGFSPISDIKDIFDNESLYNDYVSTLASMSLREQIYVGERIKIGLTRYLKNADSYFSEAHLANWMGDLGLTRILQMPFPGALNR